MKRILTILAAELLCALAVMAAPIDEPTARRIAIDFFEKNSTRASSTDLSLEWAGSTIAIRGKLGYDFEEPMLYIYNRNEAEGFVIVGANNDSTPIVGFSFDGRFDSYNMAPSLQELLQAWCEQIEASAALSPATLSETITVERKYETALWDQGTPFNDECPIIDEGRSVTGCVATAMSIICYYNQWPTKGVGTTPEYSYELNGTQHTIPSNTLGRTYNYSNMISNYNNGYTTSQAAAVAALMHDMGTSVGMMYHPNESAAYSENVPMAMSTYFGYSKSARTAHGISYDQSEWNDLLRDNIDKCGPTYFSGSGDMGGHAFILDGYATDDYFSINYGWGGVNNGYYQLPKTEFYLNQAAVVDLVPDTNGTSTYIDDLGLVVLGYIDDMSNFVTAYRGIISQTAQHTLGEEFGCMIGGIINNGSTTFNGDIQLALCDSDGNIKQTLFMDEDISLERNYYHYHNQIINVTITTPIEEGDRLRILYKGSYSKDWQWARRYSEDAVNEVLIAATPEEVAEHLSLIFDKEQKQVYLSSDIGLRIVCQEERGNQTSTLLPSYSTHTMDVQSGTYNLSIYSGERAYKLKLRF